jgi:ABC-type sugar transport system ATPase subunit
MIEVRSTFTAVKSINLDIQEREFMVLVGHLVVAN